MVVRELRKFKGRAVGKRLKELALMGLEAERLGMRVMDVDGQSVAIAAGFALAAPSPPSPAPGGGSEEPDPKAVELTKEHEAGLEDVLKRVGITF